MVQRPPFDGSGPARPGGFDPRFSEQRGPDPRRAHRPDPGYERRDPFDRRKEGQLGGPPPGRNPNRWLLIVGGLLILGAILFGLTLTRSGPGADALGKEGDEGRGETAQAAANPEARCAAPATYDLIKRELFRQAAATRGSGQEIYAELPSYATLRVSNPVLREQDEGLERVSCTANAALDLPPGLAVVGGRRTLTANIGYNLQPAADGSGEVLTLTGAEGIVVPLATLARVGSNTQTPAPEVPSEPQVVTPPAIPDAPEPISADEPQEAPETSTPNASASPSFNCARARTRGEIAVCNNSALAVLDRQMADYYRSASRSTDPEGRALLERTRSHFLTYRDRCRSDACVADAYRGRITEIRDIVDGRWREPN